MRASLFALLVMIALPGSAAIDAYAFDDPEQQVRYDQLIAELRCPMCLNTNLAGSDAMIAQDLRREVHRMILEGHSDDEILTFMYERYGDFILYRPRLSVGTAVLWFTPLLLLVLAGLVWFRFGRRQAASPQPLSEVEQAKLDQLLKGGGTNAPDEPSAQ